MCERERKLNITLNNIIFKPRIRLVYLLRQKKNIFLKKILPHYPPMLSKWFLKKFSNPIDWYNARTLYCRSLGVMSMVCLLFDTYVDMCVCVCIYDLLVYNLYSDMYSNVIKHDEKLSQLYVYML